jgi:hypothetical protein
MMLAEFFLALNSAGIKLTRVGGQLQLRGPNGAITPEIRAGAGEHKATILALLPPSTSTDAVVPHDPPPGSVPPLGSATQLMDSGAASPFREIVHIGVQPFSFDKPWDGRPLTVRDYLAFDTETELIADDR